MNNNKATSPKKKNQHIVPRTYLKHWKIADDKSFVYGIDFSNKYNDRVQRFGLNDKVFIIEYYYNHNSFDNPQKIEDILGKYVEPDYDKIMSEIIAEVNLSEPIRMKIISWLYYSKMRSPNMRNENSLLVNFILNISTMYGNIKLETEDKRDIYNYSKEIGKITQLNTLIDKSKVEEGLELYFNILKNKHWCILKSLSNYQFWTNDNPGFSPNKDEFRAKSNPFHSVMEMNQKLIIYFPLSPKYCLEFKPFEKECANNLSGLSMEVEYIQATPKLIHYINTGIFQTRNKLIIANNKDVLEYSIKKRILPKT